jgi:hypothetical protein
MHYCLIILTLTQKEKLLKIFILLNLDVFAGTCTNNMVHYVF